MAWRNYNSVEEALKNDRSFGKFDFIVKSRQDVSSKDNAIFIKGQSNVIVFTKDNVNKELNRKLKEFLEEQNNAFKEGNGFQDATEDIESDGGEQKAR